MIVTSTPLPYSEERYSQALDNVRKDPKRDTGQLFAMRCQWFREQMPDDRSDLLFIPVGHRFEGPILAALAAPSNHVMLLASRDTASQAEQVRQALRGDFHLDVHLVNPVSGKSVADKVQALYEGYGCPKRVVCDQTGGQKPTTSTLAGLAALNGWLMLYIDSTHESGLVHSEKPLWLPSLFESFGGIHRLVAEACLSHGSFLAAEAELATALETATLSKTLRQKAREVRSARLFREGDLQRFIASLGPWRKSLSSAIESCQAQPQAYTYWAARCLWQEKNRLAAEALTQRAFGNPDVEAALRAFRADNSTILKQTRPLDQRFGTGYVQA